MLAWLRMCWCVMEDLLFLCHPRDLCRARRLGQRRDLLMRGYNVRNVPQHMVLRRHDSIADCGWRRCCTTATCRSESGSPVRQVSTGAVVVADAGQARWLPRGTAVCTHPIPHRTGPSWVLRELHMSTMPTPWPPAATQAVAWYESFSMNRTERLPATVKSADKTAGLGVPASARAGVRCSCAELSSAHFAAFTWPVLKLAMA